MHSNCCHSAFLRSRMQEARQPERANPSRSLRHPGRQMRIDELRTEMDGSAGWRIILLHAGGGKDRAAMDRRAEMGAEADGAAVGAAKARAGDGGAPGSGAARRTGSDVRAATARAYRGGAALDEHPNARRCGPDCVG